jgi:O-antigen/teichoic acid export membrane protein
VLLDETQAFQKLSRFTAWLGIVTVNLLLVMAATPLAGLWFEYVAALPPALVPLASWGLWLTLPMPGLTVLQSWYQGILMHSKWTRSITESVVIFLAANAALLWAGVVWGQAGGIFVGMAAWVLGNLIRTAWLWYRVRPTMQAAQAREQYLPGS